MSAPTIDSLSREIAALRAERDLARHEAARSLTGDGLWAAPIEESPARDWPELVRPELEQARRTAERRPDLPCPPRA